MSQPTITKFGLLGAAAVAAAVALVPSAPTVAAEEPVMVWVSGGGVSRKAHEEACLNKFAAETKIKVIYVEGTADLGQIAAQVKAGTPQFDTAKLPSSEIAEAIKNGYLEKLDWSVIDKSKLTPNQYQHAWGEYAVTFDSFGWALFYNKEKWPGDNRPKSWADFWDVKKFPGPRGLDARARTNGNFEAASRALGIEADKTFPMDLDRIFKKLDEIKPHVTFWYEQGAVQTQAMLRKEVDLISAWIGRGYDAVVQGAPFDIVPETHIRDLGSMMVIPKGAKHRSNASKAIGYCGTAEAQGLYASKAYYAGTNLDSHKFIDAKIRPIISTAPEYAKTTVVIDPEWYSPRLPELRVRWTEWRTR